MAVAPYPVHMDATLDPGMSRWLWLVKWLLAIPHYVVLFFLWMAFAVVSVIAFFAILFTGRYPSSLFQFNVGVLRWTWRVAYYAYGALGTDRYPPFTLSEVADYPTHLSVDRPEHLSRGLVLVKWWLLAIPHYIVVGIFLGGGTWGVWQASDSRAGAPGLIGVLVVVAAIVLLFTGRYPQQVFDFVLGMNRWVLRVAAYASLMTDRYPPFRLDMGGNEPGATLTVPPPTAPLPPGVPAPTAPLPPGAPPPAGPPPAGPPGPPAKGQGWTAGRVVSLVVGSVLALASLGLIGAGGVATWAANTQRDHSGYVTSQPHSFSTGSYAVTSDTIDLGSASAPLAPGDVLGRLRVRATPADPTRNVFIGVGRRSAVNAYLSGVDHVVVTDWVGGDTRVVTGTGTLPTSPPATARIWTAEASGPGTQSLTWNPGGGQWVVVVMNADASPGVSVSTDVGATIPALGWIAAGLFVAGGILLLVAAVLIAVPLARAAR